jgi:hypothetical protein
MRELSFEQTRLKSKRRVKREIERKITAGFFWQKKIKKNRFKAKEDMF